jgi:hypothetical protein
MGEEPQMNDNVGNPRRYWPLMGAEEAERKREKGTRVDEGLPLYPVSRRSELLDNLVMVNSDECGDYDKDYTSHVIP